MDAVADQEASVALDWPVRKSTQDHAWVGLSVRVRRRAIRRDGRVGVERTMIKCIHVRARLRKLMLHVRVKLSDMALLIEASGHSCLIGHHDHKIAAVVQSPDGGRRIFNPLKILGPMGVAAILIEDAVAIEECRRPLSPRGNLAASARESVRQADVQEIAVILPAFQQAFGRKRRKDVLL